MTAREWEFMSATGKKGSRPNYMKVKANSGKERQLFFFFTKYDGGKDSKRCTRL